MGLSDSERILMIRSAILIQYTRVTDGRMELAWHTRAVAYMLSRVKIKVIQKHKKWGAHSCESCTQF